MSTPKMIAQPRPEAIAEALAPQSSEQFNDAESMQWASTIIIANLLYRTQMLEAQVLEAQLETEKALDDKKEAHFAATHDPLTGVGNLKGLAEFLADSGTENKAFIYADITNLKKANDLGGHAEGDALIIGAAEAIEKSVREKRDYIARTGGDEFIIVLNTKDRDEPLTSADELPTSAEEQLTIVAQRIATHTSEFLDNNPHLRSYGVDMAVGGAIWKPGMTEKEVKALAEAEMYLHKQGQHAANGGAYRPSVPN